MVSVAGAGGVSGQVEGLVQQVSHILHTSHGILYTEHTKASTWPLCTVTDAPLCCFSDTTHGSRLRTSWTTAFWRPLRRGGYCEAHALCVSACAVHAGVSSFLAESDLPSKYPSESEVEVGELCGWWWWCWAEGRGVERSAAFARMCYSSGLVC